MLETMLGCAVAMSIFWFIAFLLSKRVEP